MLTNKMTDLSLAALAVLGAMYEVNLDFVEENSTLAAAALRAAADQVVPEDAESVGDEHDDARHAQWMRVRYKLLAIAAELERANG